MLIHHFGAETHGFQGLVDQNGPKRLSLRKITFSETNIFLRGFRGREPVRTKATSSPMQILHETFFYFDLPRCKTINPTFAEIYQVVQMTRLLGSIPKIKI